MLDLVELHVAPSAICAISAAGRKSAGSTPRETEGQDLIEYALLAGFLGLATTASMTELSASFGIEFANVDATFVAAS